jgi:serine/threonine protein kinase
VDPVSGVRFAVKRLSYDTLTASTQHRAAARRSLQREIEVLRSVDHPHMVRLLGFSLSSDDGDCDDDGVGGGRGGGGSGGNEYAWSMSWVKAAASPMCSPTTREPLRFPGGTVCAP